MYHQDGTTSQDVIEQHIIDEFGIEFKNYCIGIENGKFHKVPGGASKESHLHQWKILHCFDPSAIEYVQKKFQDQCISAAFLAIPPYARFVDQAQRIDAKFVDKTFSFHKKILI